MSTYELQKLLVEKGYNPGPIDGIFGALTRAAVRQFQKDHGLLVDGVVGPNTKRALGSISPIAQEPVWYEVARSLIGVKEKPGRPSNPEILSWAEDLDIDYPGDDIPWCGLFVAHCIGSTLPEEPLPTNPLLARAWRSFGKLTAPRLGAVMVFWRGSPSGWSGHVALYSGETRTHYIVTGGNQGDKVSVARIPKGRLLEARWPISGPSTGTVDPVIVDGSSVPVSQSEA